MTTLRLSALCVHCGTRVRTNDPLTLREVVGFDRQRAQGGQNHVRFRRETGRFMCHLCAVRLEFAGSVDQVPLWEDE